VSTPPATRLNGRDENGFLIGSAAQRDARRAATSAEPLKLKRDAWPADQDGKRWCVGPCGRLLPLDAEHFAANWTGRTSAGGRKRVLRRTCRECWNAEQRRKAHTKRGKAKRRAQSRRYYRKHREAICARQRRYWHEVRKAA
jgi:hypothetical protein